VVLDQPGDDTGFIFAEPMFETKSPGVDGTQFRVITAAAFRDVVK
jgi:hypothetical protein